MQGMSRRIGFTAAAVLLACGGAGAQRVSVEEFFNLPDNKPEVRKTIGVRGARPLGPKQVEVRIGMSIGTVAANPLAYRVVSRQDERYPYEKFVTPVAATMVKEHELDAPAGCTFGVFERTVVTLELPFEMREGADYNIVAQGHKGALLTCGNSAAAFVYKAADAGGAIPGNEIDLVALGLRRLESVGEGMLRLEFGPNFSETAGSKLENYEVRVDGKVVKPLNFGRRTMLDAYKPDGWPMPAITINDIYLRLPEPLKDGQKVEVRAADSVTKANNSAVLAFDSAKSLSYSIKVNQIGYIANGPVKIAYLGRFMGSFPEIKVAAPVANTADAAEKFWEDLGDPRDKRNDPPEAKKEEPAPAAKSALEQDVVMGPALAFASTPEFHILDAKTGARAFTGASKLIHLSGQRNEGAYNFCHSGENVYLLDFTEFKTPGEWFISVPGVGRSHAFTVADDVYAKAVAVQAHGLYTARCGMALGPPHTPWTRVACHTNLLVSSKPRSAGEFIQLEYLVKRPVDPANWRGPLAKKLDADPALVGWWPLDNSLKDASGRGNDLAAVADGAAAYTAAPDMMPAGRHIFGPTARKEGAGQSGAQGEISLKTSGGATLSGWFKKDKLGQYNGPMFGVLPSGAGKGFVLNANGGSANAVAGNATASMGGIPKNENWQHYALVIPPAGEPSRRLRAYLNGRLDTLSAQEFNADDVAPGTQFNIGGLFGNESAGAFFADVRLYERALSEEEITALAKFPAAEEPVAIQAFGGHHDAGDYNPRAHIGIAQQLMNVYEMNPKKHKDGQFNIPESGNGLPDILDEAFWAMHVWLGLQDEDGGVYNGTESNGDPNWIMTVELDDKLDMTYAKDAQGCYIFAGVFAQASRLWKMNGRDKEAADFLSRAKRAYDWAEKNPDNLTAEQYGLRLLSPKSYAAAQLYHTTLDKAFHKVFFETCVIAKDAKADIQLDKKFDQTHACFAYAMIPPEHADTEVQENIRNAIARRADLYIQYSSQMAYGFLRHPWVFIFWGTGTHANWNEPVLMAAHLTKDPKYKAWIIRNSDNTLGANPMGLSYIVGAGKRTVRAPLHNSRYSTLGEVVDGFTVSGPHQDGDGWSVKETAYPKLQKEFATLYNFVDVHFAIAMNEGMSPPMAKNLASFAFLLPEEK